MADASVAITAGAGTPIRVLTALGAGVADQQVITLADSAGNLHTALTKGTQPTFAVGTQDLKDSGRTGFALAAIAAAGVTAEALLSAVAQRNGTAAGAATTQAVTAGKTLRISNITASMRLGAAAAGWSRFVLRSTYSATAATATSPAIWAAEVGPGAAAVIAATAVMTFDFPDGIELPAGSSFGISHISSATTNVETITMTGFEY